ncbi:MAG: DUF2304 domain-containing protein [Armatimonadia bacterium]
MDSIPTMTPRQELMALCLAAALFLFVVELVRRRRLREEYSWLWLLACTVILGVVLWPGGLKAVTWLTGSKTPTTSVFLLGILFLMVVCIHLCTKLTRQHDQIKQIAQQVALLRVRKPEAPREGPEGSPTVDERRDGGGDTGRRGSPAGS